MFNNLSDFVRSHALAKPTRMALSFEGRRTSYAELDVRISQVANGFLDAGVKHQERVAILDHNSDQFYEIWLGASRAGAVLVPLNARLSAAEVAQVLADCRPRLLFVGAAFSDLVAQIRDKPGFIDKIIVTGDEYSHWRDAQSRREPGVHCERSDVSFQLYTSGTTGAAKGVQATYENCLRPFEVAARGAHSPWTELGPQDVALVSLPHGHIAGCGLGAAALFAGAGLVIVHEFVPSKIVALIKQEQITMLVMVPMMIRALMAGLPAGSDDCGSLRLIQYAAAPMPTATLQQAMATFPHAAFGQLYGLTETTGPVTYLDPGDHRRIAAGDSDLALSCGRPIPEVDLRIVDDSGEPLPTGVVGEIVVRTPQVMKGYWNRPEENEAVLRDGWFHTGDMGRVDERGYVHLHDRKRDMIISGGENIYPAEVENALYGHPSVAEAAVFGVPDEKWGEAVKAAIVLKPGQAATEADVIAHLRRSLASFKIPKSIDFVPSLPRNPTGKVLRRLLREPYWKGQDRQVA